MMAYYQMSDDMISINATQISHQCYCHLENYSYNCLRMFDYLHNNFRYYPGSSQVLIIHIINIRWQLLMSVPVYLLPQIAPGFNQGMFFKSLKENMTKIYLLQWGLHGL